MTAAPWPRAILPQDRDNRFNTLMDSICVLYRHLQPGEVVTGMSVTTSGSGWQAVLLTRGGDGVRRLVITDEKVP